MPDAPSKPRSALEVRKKVLADPNTAKIAEKLGVPLEEYVEGVVHFAMNPEQLPEYVVASDADLKEKFGLDPAPNDQQIIKIFEENLKFATLNDTTDFKQAEKAQVALDASGKPTTAEDPLLKEELKKKLTGKNTDKA
jgi:hypothetical protein